MSLKEFKRKQRDEIEELTKMFTSNDELKLLHHNLHMLAMDVVNLACISSSAYVEESLDRILYNRNNFFF